MGVEVMAFAYLGGPDRKLLMSAPAVHPKTREVLAGSGCVDVPVDGNFFENGISVPGDGGHKMEEDEVELVGQKSKRRKAATEVQGRFLMLEETGMVTSSGPMNVLKVGEKVLMDSKDGGLFDCNQSSGENGPVSVARWRVQRQSKVEKKHKVYQQSFSVLSSGVESVKTVKEAGGEVFFELKKEIKKGGEDSGVERPLLSHATLSSHHWPPPRGPSTVSPPKGRTSPPFLISFFNSKNTSPPASLTVFTLSALLDNTLNNCR
jgi:hypothetical protein